MKRIVATLLLCAMLSALCGCSSDTPHVVLAFKENGLDISETLSPEDSQQIARIFSSMRFNSFGLFSSPACGFSPEVSLAVNGRVYAVAMDKCTMVLDCGTLCYYQISQAEREYIESLFAQYGAHFPCV